MPLAPTLVTSMEDWLLGLEERQRSPQTLRSYRASLAQWRAWLEAQPHTYDLTDLRVHTIIDYVKWLQQRGLRRRSLHIHIGVVTRWLQFLVDHGRLAGGLPNRLGQIETPNGVRDLLLRLVGPLPPSVAPRVPDLRALPNVYPAQLEEFLRQRGGQPPAPSEKRAFRTYLSLLRDQALIGVLFCSGGRVSEVLSLNVRQVLTHGTIAAAVRISGKGRKERPLRLDADARRWLSRYLSARRTLFPTAEAVFISHGPRGAGQRISTVEAWRTVKEAAERLADHLAAAGASAEEVAAVREVSPHSLRHFFAQALLDEGADFKDIAAILGHASVLITEQIYARLSEERMLEIADTFAPRRAQPRRDED